MEATNSLTEIGSIAFWKSTKPDSGYCQNFRNKLLNIPAAQGHTGGGMIEPEMMGHVFIRINWIQFVFHQRRN